MKPLTLLKEHLPARVERLEGGPNFQRKLRTLGIREGKRVVVVTYNPMGGPVVVSIDGRNVTLGRNIAKRVLVQEI